MTQNQAEQPDTAEVSPSQEPLLRCPFCGSDNLLDGFWCLDDEEVDAVECGSCYAGAPIKSWNNRHATTLVS